MRSKAAPFLIALALLANAGSSQAKPPPAMPAGKALTLSEKDALRAGQIVSRPLHFARGLDGVYVGGVSYQLIKATPAEVMSALVDVEALPQLLPRTKRASLIESSGDRARIELVQG
ncbi:MAG TPA: hypothetical protein VGP93_02340, partial [Polyangiaceae bacterium]|nr:hypothetical protein [Polyangiaceae bacterium]